MTTAAETPALEEYWARLEPHLRPFSREEQRAAVALYRELAKGKAVDADQLGRALGICSAEARALLERDSIKCFVYPDGQGRVLVRPGERRDGAPCRDAGPGRERRASGDSRLIRPARSGSVPHVRQQRDGEVLPFRLLLRLAAIR